MAPPPPIGFSDVEPARLRSVSSPSSSSRSVCSRVCAGHVPRRLLIGSRNRVRSVTAWVE